MLAQYSLHLKFSEEESILCYPGQDLLLLSILETAFNRDEHMLPLLVFKFSGIGTLHIELNGRFFFYKMTNFCIEFYFQLDKHYIQLEMFKKHYITYKGSPLF